ncbi:MAG: bifunctional UDP-N-acetylglucosamine diphosphorylase/glucosamine-1-phosphate N-acetyltransferase GlmU [Pseudomonadota bacterium]
MPTALIVLAAGKGTRMQSDLPKVLHQIAGAPLLVHALRSGRALEPEKTVVVTGHEAEAVKAAAEHYDDALIFAHQAEQLGTAHAVDQAREALEDFEGDAFVLYGDTPFLSSETLEKMRAARDSFDVVVLGFTPEDPKRYGRLITQGDRLEKVVEWKDASPEERAITLCNSGVIACDAQLMFALISKIENTNIAGEYYLTDLPRLANEQGKKAGVVTCDAYETQGVDSGQDLARAETLFQSQMRTTLTDTGVTLQAPETVIFAHDTVIGRDAIIEPYVVFANGVTVESGATIRAFSHLEACHVARGSVVGPYARLRPGTELNEDVKVGNFVEIKNATLHEGAKVNHLSYIGDAEIGKATNVGAGTITCNYDGVLKHRTEIGENAFIGSNTMLVAPVSIGDEAMTASGSVITKNVPAEALAIARAKQDNKAGFATRLMDKLRAIKASKN